MTEQNSPDGTDVFIGLGSNIEARANLPRGLRALAERVRLVGVSRVYETDPVDAPGTPMYPVSYTHLTLPTIYSV